MHVAVNHGLTWVVVAALACSTLLHLAFAAGEGVVQVPIPTASSSAEPVPTASVLEAPRLMTGSAAEVEFLWSATMGGAADVFYAYANEAGTFKFHLHSHSASVPLCRELTH
jgi:hypothetical protein